MALVASASLIRPSWFRGFYRLGMTIGHWIGRVMGAVILAIFFFAILTPMGLLLRLLGKDLLQIKRPDSASTYWQKAKTSNNFDRQF
jgi:polyferredoxin